MRHFTISLLGEAKGHCLRVPSKWSEITTAQFIRLFAEPNTSPLLILTPLTESQLESAQEDINSVIEALGFLRNAGDLEGLLPDPTLPTVGESTYGQLLLAMQRIEQLAETPPLSYAPYLYALYRSRQISRKLNALRVQVMEQAVLASPITETYANLNFYLKQLSDFWQLQAADPTADNEYSDEELDAGADELEKFGAFATLDMLAGGDPTKYEQVLELDADTALQKVRLVQLQNQVQKRMRKQQLTNTQQ